MNTFSWSEQQFRKGIHIVPEPEFDSSDGLGAMRGLWTALKLMAFFGLAIWIAIELANQI